MLNSNAAHLAPGKHMPKISKNYTITILLLYCHKKAKGSKYIFKNELRQKNCLHNSSSNYYGLLYNFAF